MNVCICKVHCWGTDIAISYSYISYLCNLRDRESDRHLSSEIWISTALCGVFLPFKEERVSERERDSVSVCGLYVNGDRTSCADSVTSLLQCYARFDLVFEEQVLPFCSHCSRLCGLTRWKMPPGGEGSYFSSWTLWLFFSSCGWRQSLFQCKSLLFEMHIAHWFGFICLGFVVGEDDTVTALSGAVSCEGRSPNSSSVNPIVFSPMWGKGDWILCVCVCLWITESSASADEPLQDTSLAWGSCVWLSIL